MRKKRVLMVIPNLDFGGAQNSFARVSLLLEPYYHVQLVVFNKENLAPVKLGGELHELGVYGSSFIGGKAINLIRRVVRLRNIKKKFKPHVSISFLEGADYINILSSVGEQTFLYIHGSKLFDRNIKGVMGFLRKKFMIPLFYSNADQILVVNEAIEHELKNHFKLKAQSFTTMHNFYDFKQIREQAVLPLSKATEFFFSTNKVICISGRLAPEKGIDRFVEALPDILRKHNDVKVALIGDGNEYIKIECALNKYGITYGKINEADTDDYNRDVLFFGYQRNPYAYMKRSYILALPSLNEGMPNTVVEAMGLGVPVIAADCPYGPRELLSTERSTHEWPAFSAYGVLVPVLNSPDAIPLWVKAVNTLISTPELYKKYQTSGMERAEEFSQDNSIGRWQELLDKE